MHPPKILLWLLPLVGAFSLGALADTTVDPSQALHLLSYLAADYPPTVADGKIVDPSEYQEQVEFVGNLQALVLTLPMCPERADLEKGVDSLRQAIEQRLPGREVALQARNLEARVADIYQVVQTPAITPDPSRAAPIYAQQCAICHGDAGKGDGPAGIGLEPPPANLTDRQRLDHLSLYDLRNVIGLGVAGTDMPAFADQLDERQRWDLASYVAGLSAGGAQPDKAHAYPLATLATQTPAEVAEHDGEAAAESFRALRAHPPLEQRGPAQLIDYTAATLDKSFAVYREGDRDQAYDLSVAAYLEGFELVESSLDNVDADLRRSTEKQLMAYRQALRDGLPETQVAQQLELAKNNLAEAAKRLGGDSLSFSISFVSALLILLREGVEAILVLAAILAFLRNTGQEHAVRGVHVGWGLAFVAGFATWALAAYVITIGGAQRELMEGFTSLFACAMVLWLGVWMHDRRHAAAWQDYIRSSLVGGGGRFGFAVLAFFSVYRELFEVILFYETLWLQAGPAGHNAVIGGAATAVVLLVGLAWVILRGSAKLPLGLFFSINAALLCALSVVFAGHGVIALQEAGVIGTRPVPFFDFDWLGIKADAYSLSAQALALVAIALLYGRSRLVERRRAAANAAG
ncbi:cytochrome c/FTR1 family iron permease [Pseudomonas aeruginosa]|uniref:cytochrome c/FTR1 family iron permease n=2 Tax=Pseudomonas aeruginosa TaxID=287 RepID=UPI001068C8DA|nr:cytochrome c/FTR1 family iron permease [Pseudomonas aeruginosa]EIU1678922.1 cytochrome c/FTR1 family iron permease [Pseudomonas aeruginosa]TEC55316.1 c-type cytochrome [Pseudomonas aeruginosa]